ncbi:MAG: ATP-binding protein, partial [Methanosarcinales archaeon]
MSKNNKNNIALYAQSFVSQIRYNYETMKERYEANIIDGIENALFFYNPWWVKKMPFYLVKRYKREVFYKIKEYLNLNRIVVIKGPRRVGKTTVMYQLIDYLLQEVKPEEILYVPFDDPKLTDIDKIIDFYQSKILKASLDEKKTYLFLDEVQYLENWQYLVKKYYDRNYPIKFIVSGSSATLIRKGTESLMGRTIEEILLPFSFKEFFQYRFKKKIVLSLDKLNLIEIKRYERAAKILFEEYLLKGGFPNIFEIKEIELWQKVIKEDVIDKAIYRDIVTLYDIKNPLLLEKLFLYLVGITGQILNVNNISRSIGLSRAYVNKYLFYLKNAYFILGVKKYAKSIEKIIKSNEKVYVLDSAIINSLLNKTRVDENFAGHLVESVVAEHLIMYECYYWRNYYEVDFIVKIKNRLVPIEVKYRSKINKKDLKGLVRFMEIFNVNKGFIITKDFFKKEEIDLVFIEEAPLH